MDTNALLHYTTHLLSYGYTYRFMGLMDVVFTSGKGSPKHLIVG